MTLLKAFHQLFADDTSIFSVFNDINVSADQMNKDLEKDINAGLSVENVFQH